MGKTDPAERQPSISYMNFQIPISVSVRHIAALFRSLTLFYFE